jgi:drug/metabolite transporter (DMT)-like permease
MHRDPRRAYAYLAAAILGWATAASAFKFGLQHLAPTALLILSAGSSCLILGMALVVTGRAHLVAQQKGSQLALSALQGLLNPFGYYGVLFQAYDRLSAQAALALNYTWPLVLALLAVPLLGERLRGRLLLALGTSLLGVVLVTTGDPGAPCRWRIPGEWCWQWAAPLFGLSTGCSMCGMDGMPC